MQYRLNVPVQLYINKRVLNTYKFNVIQPSCQRTVIYVSLKSSLHDTWNLWSMPKDCYVLLLFTSTNVQRRTSTVNRLTYRGVGGLFEINVGFLEKKVYFLSFIQNYFSGPFFNSTKKISQFHKKYCRKTFNS